MRIWSQPVRLVIGAMAVLALGCGERAPSLRAARHTGDLPEIRERSTLRILSPLTSGAPGLARGRTPLQLERRLAEAFAESQGVEPEWVWVEEYDQLIPALLDGRGDLVVANMTVTPERRARVAFGAGVAQVREVVVTHRDSAPVTSVDDLAGRTVSVRRSSSFWVTLDSLRHDHPMVHVVEADERLSAEELLYAVATGAVDATIADDIVVDMFQSYRPEVRADVAVTGNRVMAWAMRPKNVELHRAVDAFVGQFNPDVDRPERYLGDLPEIRDRKVLRVLTRNNAATYFVWRGEVVGFEHDLAVEFAKRLGIHVEFIVAPTRAALIGWLVDGRGDLIAASWTVDTTRQAIASSRPYNHVVETVVARADDSLLGGLDDLAGRSIAVRRTSSYWRTAERLRSEGYRFELVAAPEEMETEEIIDRVAAGEFDLTIADSHILDIELTWRDDVRAAFTVSDTVAHAWQVRRADHELLAAINAYFDDIYRGAFYNITKRKYFGNPRSARAYATRRAARAGEISPYDRLIKRYADRFGFDWLTVASQMYQESRFDPTVVSFAGAVGLMQIMPQTARGFGFDSLQVPEVNIHAGTRYLWHVYGLLDDVPNPQERMWFALASYNAGYGHIEDARRIAAEQGKDPDLWFDNVAEVAPLLMRRSVHQQAKYGYCRCNEPVDYVRKIRDRERAYATAQER